MAPDLLSVQDVSVTYSTESGIAHVLDQVITLDQLPAPSYVRRPG